MSWASWGFAFSPAWGHEGEIRSLSLSLLTKMAPIKRNHPERKGRKKLGRIPLPLKTSRPQTTKKGKRGYDRKRENKDILKERAEDLV